MNYRVVNEKGGTSGRVMVVATLCASYPEGGMAPPSRMTTASRLVALRRGRMRLGPNRRRSPIQRGTCESTKPFLVPQNHICDRGKWITTKSVPKTTSGVRYRLAIYRRCGGGSAGGNRKATLAGWFRRSVRFGHGGHSLLLVLVINEPTLSYVFFVFSLSFRPLHRFTPR